LQTTATDALNPRIRPLSLNTQLARLQAIMSDYTLILGPESTSATPSQPLEVKIKVMRWEEL